VTDDDRFDIDLGALGRALLRNWVIIVILMVVGVVAAVGVTLAAGKRYQAASAVYLGQPTDANGNPINGINSNPRGAQQIVQSGSVLKAVAASVRGISASRLRNEVSVDTPTVTVKSVSAPTNFVTITVRDPSGTRAVKAANGLADALVAKISTYADQKTALLNRQITNTAARLSGLDTRVKAAQDALNKVASSGGTPAERASISATYLAIIQSAGNLRDQLIQALQSLQLTRVVAREVEQPSVFSKASLPAQRVTQGSTLAIGAGLIAGLIVGCVLALVRERIRGRRTDRGTPDAPAETAAPAA
jgi:capsular polysaccharide biosynthesis protein